MAYLLHELFLRRLQSRCGNVTYSVEEDIAIFSEQADRLGSAFDGPFSPQMVETLRVRPPVEVTVVLPLLELLLAPNADG